MVEVEEIVEDEVPPSQERLLDAQEIEQAAATMTRPTARMHLEGLAKKLRKESEALKRVEASRSKFATTGSSSAAASEETNNTKAQQTTTPTAAAIPKKTPVTAPPVVSSSVSYVPIHTFAFDAGSYNSAFVTLYIDLPGVGSMDDRANNIVCQFTKDSFDLIVQNLNGKSYRLCKANLEHEIDTDKSKKVVKADKVLVKLAKKKTEYGSYEHWSSLSAKATSSSKAASKGSSSSNKMDNPTAGIMDLMKEMYDSGDDKMRKVIGETMMKQREGTLGGTGMEGGMGGMGGLGDLDMDV